MLSYFLLTQRTLNKVHCSNPISEAKWKKKKTHIPLIAFNFSAKDAISKNLNSYKSLNYA